MRLAIKFRPNAAEKIRKMVDDRMERGPYIPAHLAVDLVKQLREEEPQLLAEWLDAQAESIMRDMVNSINRHRRAIARKVASKSVFRNAVERAEAGEPALLEGWLAQEYPVNQNNIRKPLGDMVKEEVLYASDVHDRLARGNQMQAAFLKAVANKVGARQVSEVFDNDQLNVMWRSLP